MLRVRVLLGMLFATLLLASGCGGGKYRLETAPSPEARIPATVVVLPFTDERPFERQTASLRKSVPFALYLSYRFSRHDEVYASASEPFAGLLSREFADAVEESGYFDKVIYAEDGQLPELGTYDLVLKGTLKSTTSYGSVIYYCLAFPFDFNFYDILWYVGFPKFTRRWELGLAVQMEDGYTGAPIGELVESKFKTSRRYFTRYAEESKIGDLNDKINPLWNGYIGEIASAYPSGSDNYWANLQSEGREHLADLAAEQERIRRGTPPTFAFLAPSEGAVVRGALTNLRWSATAPNGMSSLRLEVNGTPVPTGIADSEFANRETAPRAIAARDLEIALQLGENSLHAVVGDVQENVTEANLNLIRYPKQVVPEARYALIVGMGSHEAVQAAGQLAAAVTDPLLGQFRPADVITVTDEAWDAAKLESALDDFSYKPLADQLAFIYVAAPGDAAAFGLGADGAVSLADLTQKIDQVLATDEVILALDVQWANEDNAKRVLPSLGSLPSRWAIMTSNRVATAPGSADGAAPLGWGLAKALRGSAGDREVLTLEKWVDAALVAVESADGVTAKPDVTGRYNPNIIMAERE